MPIYTNGRDTSLRVLGRGPGSGDVAGKTLSVSPVVVGARRSFFTENGINMSRVVASVSGQDAPSVRWTLKFASSLDAEATEVIEGGTNTVDVSAGSDDILFTNARIQANSFIWLEVLEVMGAAEELSVTIIPELT